MSIRQFFTVVLICLLITNIFAQDSNDDLRKQLQDLKQKVWELEQRIQEKDAEKEEDKKEVILEEKIKNLEEKVNQHQTIEKNNKILGDKVLQLEKKVNDLKAIDDGTFDIYWKSNLALVSKDKNYEFSFGFFFFVDLGFVSEGNTAADVIGAQEDFADFRQFRPYVKGTLYDTYYFMLEVDLANDNDVAFRNAYIGVKNLPGNGKFQVGFMKEPFSLEQLMGAVNLTFLERSLIDVFTPKFQLGMLYQGYSDSERFTYALGVFKHVVDDAPPTVNDSGSFDFSTRITGLPIYAEDGKYLVHLGLGYSYQNPPNDQIVLNFKPEINQVDAFQQVTFVDDVENAHLVGLEWGMIFNNFSLQAEGIAEIVVLEDNDTADLFGYYIYGSYLLTVEHRSYDKKNGVFGRPKPNSNFLIEECGTGAVELAARYSYVFLNDNDTLTGNRQEDITVGLNWYVTDFLRLEANYIYSKIHDFELGGDGKDAHSHFLAFRARVVF